MPIPKKSDTECSDGMAHDDSGQKSHRAAGGGMPIHKIQGIQQTHATTCSQKMGGTGSTPHGNKSVPEKPPLNHQLTGLFLLKDKIPASTENSDNKSQICKISEAQSENPEKPEKVTVRGLSPKFSRRQLNVELLHRSVSLMTVKRKLNAVPVNCQFVK